MGCKTAVRKNPTIHKNRIAMLKPENATIVFTKKTKPMMVIIHWDNPPTKNDASLNPLKFLNMIFCPQLIAPIISNQNKHKAHKRKTPLNKEIAI